MKNQQNTKLILNILKDDNKNNDFIYCWHIFGSRPNKISIYSSFTKEVFDSVLINYTEYKNSSLELIPAENFDIINDKSIIKINSNIYLSYHILDKESEKSFIHEIIFLYKTEDDLQEINKIIEELNKFSLELEENNDYFNLNTVFVTQNGIEVEPIEKTFISENIDLFYNKHTIKSINKLTKKLNKTNKGLTIFYGERGLGKTSMINFICEKLDRMVIYIPNNMLDLTLNSPDFKTFIRKYSKPLIILDDCELIFNELFSKSNIYVNNILQMVDGLLADSIGLNIITIFNVESENEIDHVLLDCNSLIDIINFDLLSKDKSNMLAKHLGFKQKYENKNKLVNIIKNLKTDNLNKKIQLN